MKMRSRHPTIRKIYDDGLVEISLNSKKGQSSFKRTYEWLRDCCVPSFFIARQVMGEDKFNEFISYKESDLNPRKRALLSLFRKEWDKGMFYEDDV